MIWLLKILQGPNAGAEIELPEGIVTRIGRSLECDVMLQDKRMAEEAVSLEPQGASLVMTPLAEGCRIGSRTLVKGRAEEVPAYTPFLLGGSVCCCGDAEAEWPALDLEPLFATERATAEDIPTDSALRAGGVAEEHKEEAASQDTPSEERERHPFPWHVILWVLFILVFLALSALAGYYVWNLTIPEKDQSQEFQQRRMTRFQELVKAHGLHMTGGSSPEDVVRISGNFVHAADRRTFSDAAYATFPNCILDLSDDETIRDGLASALTGLTEDGVEVLQASNRTASIQGMVENFSEWTRMRETLLKEIPHLEKLDDEKVIFADDMCRRFQKGLRAAGLADVTVRSGKRQFVFAGAVPENQKGTFLAILEESGKYVPENVSVIHAVRWKDNPVRPPHAVTPAVTVAPPPPVVTVALPPPAPTPEVVPEEEPPVEVELPPPPPLPLSVAGIMLSPMRCIVLQDGSRCLEGGTTRGCTVKSIQDDCAVILYMGLEYTWKP